MSTHVSPGPPQSAKVFISYRREDSAGHAGRLLDRITSYFGDRVEIFMDVDSIAPGEDFIHVIENAVGACEILVAVIGNDWLTITDETGKRRLDNPEDFVRVEIATALKRNVRVIPVLVQGARMPRRDQLPEPLVNLTRRNAIEVSDARWKYDADRLIKTIEEVSSLESTGAEINGPAGEVGMSRLWSWRILVPVLGILLLSIGLWLLLPLLGNGSNEVTSNNPSGSNLNSSETGNIQPNSNTNNSPNANSTPSINSGAGTPGSTNTPITTVPETQGIHSSPGRTTEANREVKPMATVFGAINDKWNEMGAGNSPLKQPVNNEQPTFDGVGRWQQFQGGIISWHPATGAHVVLGLIGELWLRLGREKFGYPITDELPTSDRRGLFNHFRALHLPNHPDASIFWSRNTGAHAVYGAIRERWAALGWERSRLGFPKSEEHAVRVGGADYLRSDFEKGYILWSAETGAREHITSIDDEP